MTVLLLHGLIPTTPDMRPQKPEHRLVRCGPITAISRLLDDPKAFENSDPDAAAALAMQHHETLQLYCADHPVLPIALGTAFSGDAALLQALARDLPDYLAALDDLRDLAEYCVTLKCDPTPTTPPPAPASGRDFLMQRRLDKGRRDEVLQQQHSLAGQIANQLGAVARHVTQGRAQHADRIINCAILVPRADIPRLIEIASVYDRSASALGMTLSMTGPWPAYSYDMRKHQGRDVA